MKTLKFQLAEYLRDYIEYELARNKYALDNEDMVFNALEAFESIAEIEIEFNSPYAEVN